MSSAGSSRRSPAAGFTLIELLAVLLLAGLVLAIVPPLFNNAFPGVQLKSTVRTLVSGLRQARNEAIAQARVADLVIDMEAREFRVPGRPQPIAIPPHLDLSMTVAASQRQGDQRAGVAFFPDGSSTGGRIHLSRGSQAYAVDVDWLTGKVTLLE